LCGAEELAKKCRGKDQKCCSVSDNEGMSKKIFGNKNVRHIKITYNYAKHSKEEVHLICSYLYWA
jgi:hypothetical protein